MPKRTTPYALTLPTPDGVRGAHWLTTSLRHEILAGRLRAGARLPSTRELAQQYGVARGTVVNAFDQLKSEGYLDGSQGSGTYVSAVLPDALLHVDNATVGPRAASRTTHRLSAFGRRMRAFDTFDPLRPVRAFRPNLPALDHFPSAPWARLAARRVRTLRSSLLLGCEPLGYAPLRAAIAEYVGAARGVRCDPQQILIVSGTQEALDLSVRLLLDPGDRALIEDPGYDGARSAFVAAGARIRAVPVDAEGMLVPPARARDARLLFVTPGHQYPLGVTMSLRRRLALLDWARDSGTLIFEDDYDSEFRYSGRPVPALQGLDRADLVLFAGTFSKVLFPALRLGYLVVPARLVDTFAAAKSLVHRHAPLLEQAILCDFITEGHFGRHLRRMREIYAQRLDVLLEHAHARLAGMLNVSPIEAGLQTVATLREGIDADALAHAAAQRQVEIVPIDLAASGAPAVRGVQLGFAAVDLPEIRRGVRELSRLVNAIK